MLSKIADEKIYINEPPKSVKLKLSNRALVWLDVGLLALLVVAALLLRLFNLTYNSLWFDETYNLYLVRGLGFREAITFFQPWLIHPPLFLGVMNLWMRYVGFDEFSLRSFAVLSSIGTLPVVFVIARRWINRAVAFTALALIALSAINIYNSQNIRPYALFTTLAAVSMGLAYAASEKPKQNWRWFAYGLSVVVLLYLHYLALHVLFAELVFFAFAFYKNWRLYIRLVITLAGVGVAYLPWLGNFREHTKFFGDSLDYLTNGGLSKLFSALPLLSAWFIDNTQLFLVGAVFLPLYALGLVWLWRKERKLAVLLAVWSFLPYLTAWSASFLTPNFSLQRLAFCQPGFLIIVAAGIWSLRPRGQLAYLALGAALLLSLSATLNYFQNYHNQDWRGVVNYIVANRQEGDVIFLSNKNDVTQGSFDYYYVEQLGAPGNMPRLWVDENEDPAKVVPARIKNAKRIWIVRWFISDHDAWFQQKVLPFITAANFELAGYKDFPSSEQSTTDIRLYVRR